jgi:hypothetical protein
VLGRLEMRRPAPKGGIDVRQDGRDRALRAPGVTHGAIRRHAADRPRPPLDELLAACCLDAVPDQQLARHEALDLLAGGAPLARFGGPQRAGGEVERGDAEAVLRTDGGGEQARCPGIQALFLEDGAGRDDAHDLAIHEPAHAPWALLAHGHRAAGRQQRATYGCAACAGKPQSGTSSGSPRLRAVSVRSRTPDASRASSKNIS